MSPFTALCLLQHNETLLKTRISQRDKFCHVSEICKRFSDAILLLMYLLFLVLTYSQTPIIYKPPPPSAVAFFYHDFDFAT